MPMLYHMHAPIRNYQPRNPTGFAHRESWMVLECVGVSLLCRLYRYPSWHGRPLLRCRKLANSLSACYRVTGFPGRSGTVCSLEPSLLLVPDTAVVSLHPLVQRPLDYSSVPASWTTHVTGRRREVSGAYNTAAGVVKPLNSVSLSRLP